MLAICHAKWHDYWMEAVITIDKFGRMVLPGPMRKALQISRPAAFKAEVMGNKIELTLVAPERGAVLKKRRGLLVVSTGGRKFNAAEAVSAMRQERF
jgi:bifunctional DNA-binding transcriptional regulator/antitoxin component of YhaV-PrlF toxin-antitoxin module